MAILHWTIVSPASPTPSSSSTSTGGATSGDIRLQWDDDAHAGDLAIEANDLSRDDGLETAVLLSLFLDRRAEDTDTLPPGQTDRRGWWGDEFAEVDGDKAGSRLWLLEREVWTPDVARRAEEYAREALQWMLDDKVAATVEVTAELPSVGLLRLLVDVARPTDPAVKYKFDILWQAQTR